MSAGPYRWLDHSGWLPAALMLSAAITLQLNLAAPSASAQLLSEAMSKPSFIHVPLVRQATDYSCGAAALQSVLAYFGDQFCESWLVRRLGTNPRHGTGYQRLAAFARALGYDVQAKANMSLDDLLQATDEGAPVICLIQAWALHPVDYRQDRFDGHYVVVLGGDQSHIYMMDPWTLGNYTSLGRNDFLDRWHDRQQGANVVHLGIRLTKGKPNYDPQAIKKIE